MLQLLGHYSRIPCDSETVRHLHKVHNLQSCTLANVQRHAQQVGWDLPHSCTDNTHAIGLSFCCGFPLKMGMLSTSFYHTCTLCLTEFCYYLSVLPIYLFVPQVNQNLISTAMEHF